LEFNARKIISVLIGLIVIIFLILLIIRITATQAPFKATERAVINNHSFKIKIAQTEREKEVGLSETKFLPDGYAMSFPFGERGYYSFWMKNMKFPIDIIYINNGKIVKVFSNVPAPQKKEPLKIYVSPSPADTVLEIRAGLAEKYKFKEGDLVSTKKI
jgi:hypothetical protein